MNGEQDWKEVVEAHGPLVWQAAYRLLDNHADVADCFQETFLAAWQLSRTQPVRHIRSLLVRLATAKAIDRLRYRRRWAQRCVGSTEADDLPGVICDPSSQSQAMELADGLRAALTHLPSQQAQAFCLRHLNDMSQQEVALELGVSANAAGVLIHRARKRLQQILRTHVDNPSEVLP